MPSWIIGDVIAGSRTAEIAPDFKVIDVDNKTIIP